MVLLYLKSLQTLNRLYFGLTLDRNPSKSVYMSEEKERICPYAVCFAEMVTKHRMPVCFYVCDQSGRFIYAMGQILYDMHPDLLSKTCWEIHKDDPKGLKCYEKVLNDRIPQRYQIVHQGKLFIVITEPIEGGGCQGVAFEATTDASLLDKWASICTSLPIAIATIGDDGSFLEVSKKYAQITGRSHTDLVGMKYWEITHPDDVESSIKLHEQLKAGGEHFSSKKRYIKPNGDEVWVLLDAAYITSQEPGGENITLKFVQDITEDILIQTKITFDSEVRYGIANKEFEVWYQPIVSLEDKSTVGYEALLRWRTESGLLYPKDFIDRVSPEVMPELCLYILGQIGEKLSQWTDPERKDLFVSMNLAPVSMSQEFEDMFNGVVTNREIDRKRLHLEITERDVINTPIIRFLLEGFRKRGHSIAIDDFPTGQSNFATLYSFPADILKIDMSLIIGIEEDLGKQRIVQAITALCNSFGFTMIAEGVETEECRQWLLNNGISLGQGYLFGKAVPLD
jgi:PAS domain S-box-containing protein